MLSARLPASLGEAERSCIFKATFQATELEGGEDEMPEPPSLLAPTALDLPALPQLKVPLHNHKKAITAPQQCLHTSTTPTFSLSQRCIDVKRAS